MKSFALAVGLLVLPALGHAGDVWRWTDADGKTHYSNVVGALPHAATPVETTITIETTRLPGASRDAGFVIDGGVVVDAGDRSTRRAAEEQKSSRWLPDPPKIYDDARLRYGCVVGNALWSGGFSHPDDIAVGWNCAPYRLGPGAWLNAAKAELALRENGISPLELKRYYDETNGLPQ
jgi:hypothetical protein